MRKLGPLGGMAALILLAGCSESGTLAPSESGALSFKAASPFSIPAPGSVVVPGLDAGAFANAIVADNSGRATTEFWDNPSADDAATHACNLGFYATGTMASDCRNEAAGSTANQGGFTSYWGDGADHRDPSAFTFNGTYSYNVRLLGSYAGSASQEVGWFIKDNTGYHFTNIPAWASRTIGTEITVPAGANWGFYIRNTFNTQTGGCLDPTNDCSDAEGGFTTIPLQQFALMINAAGTRYLVGTEDNVLGLDPTHSIDSDYNDYIFVVEPIAPELLNGRMTGGGGKVVSSTGADVTYGLTLHCDITLSNNLEINWGSHHWHLDKPITLADCQDDPNISPPPPAAPFDTFNGEGMGSLDGVPGSRVVFTFVDDGEGNNSGDKAMMTVYAPGSNTVALSVPLQLTVNGDIQAHYDQPHGQHP